MSTMLTDEDFARRAAVLAERASAEHAESWRPNVPAKGHPQLLVGVLVRLDRARTSYGPATIVVLRAPDGKEWAIWLLHAVLRDEFERLRPCAGELVAVAYGGMIEARGDKAAYESYRVAVDRDAGAVDWGAIETGPEATTAPPEATAAVCDQCGFAEPDHAAGCIPF